MVKSKDVQSYNLVFIVILLIVIFFFSYKLISNHSSSLKDENYNPPSSLKIEKNLIPDENYTCEDLVPERMNLEIMGLDTPSLYGVGELKYGIDVAGDYCRHNTEVGQKASGFECSGSHTVQNRLSEEGIILRDYRIEYTFYFDDEECSEIGINNRAYLNCKVLDYSCSWRYGPA